MLQMRKFLGFDRVYECVKLLVAARKKRELVIQVAMHSLLDRSSSSPDGVAAQ
jgi:hypothetical protein